MNKILSILFICLLPLKGYALDVPQLRGHVNDYAGMLSPQAAQQLEARLVDFERTDSTQVVVLTVPSLEGEDLEGFSIRVAEAWRIGQKGLDNGVILVLARQERKIRLEVGRGLEGRLTDLVAGRIIRNEMTPRMKAGDIDAGIAAGVAAITAAVRGEYTAKSRDIRHGRRGANPIFTLIIFLVVVCVFLGAISRILGGIAGAVGLPLVSFLSFQGVSLLLLAVLAFAGLAFGLFLPFLFGRSGRGGPFIGGWGGGYGGFGGGGGFGGFSGGGGGFGGGGASGDW